jgi:beta-xylosidase
MISTTGTFTYLNLPGFTEAPYINKINGTYYLSYASGMPESIVYATSNSPLGPFTRRGTLNATIPNSPTNHQSLVQFRNTWYFVYHSAALPGGGEFHRSVAIDALTLNSDGTFRQLMQTAAGITQLDPGPFRSDVYYRITSSAGARVLDISGAATISGANVQQSTWTAANSQQWKLSAVGSGTYQIVNRQSEHCVEVLNGGLTEGVNVQQATCAKINQQYWRLVGTHAGDYAFVNVATGKALGLAPTATGEGANVAQYAYAGAPTHAWQVAIAP